MHEMSLCESLLQILESEAARQGFSRVKTVWLEIGELASIEIDALRFSYDVVTRNSLADGSTLEIIRVPGTAWCRQCARSVNITQRFDACPECGGYRLQVTDGEAMRIKELEVE